MIVPPLWLDGLTTLVTAALKTAALDEPPPPPPPLPPLLPPQAAATRATTAPIAASPMVLYLLIGSRASLFVRTRACRAYLPLRGSSASRSPSPNRLKDMIVMKMATPGMIMYMGSTE